MRPSFASPTSAASRSPSRSISPTSAGLEPVEMLGYVPFPTITDEPYALTLAPYSFLWLELQPAALNTRAAA